MSTLAHWQALIGTWTGTSRLFLPGEPTRESDTTASVAIVAQGKFCTINYAWSFDAEPQAGMLLLGYKPDQATVNAVFIDSWHMGDKLMLLQGAGETQDAIDVRGSYAVESGSDWGWRMVVEPGAKTWRMLMYNVTPEGEEFLGVEATYSRTT
jgi:hypothetical protein